MLDQIATWVSRYGASFEAYKAMVDVWASDATYWSAQPMSRLFSEATGEAPRAVTAAIFRV